MELAVDAFPFGIDQFEGVGAVAIHVAVAIGQSAIAEQERHLQTGRRRVNPEAKQTPRQNTSPINNRLCAFA